MIVMTILCLFLALPGGYILVGIVLTWATLQAAILWLLTTIQKPLYRLCQTLTMVSGISRKNR